VSTNVSEHTHGAGSDRQADIGFDQGFWDDRYRSSDRIWSGKPNVQLVAEVTRLRPGRALDVGCGEGADAIWLAQQGWRVVAADISPVALERAERHATSVDPKISVSIEWCRIDLLADPPDPQSFDLVSAQFMQLPPDLRRRMFAALAAAVRPGGALLVVGHHPSDLESGVARPPMPERFYTGDEITEVLGDSWSVVVNEARPRSAITPDGRDATIHDAVLLATRLDQ
jgi:SAM-dependent methyltransferase